MEIGAMIFQKFIVGLMITVFLGKAKISHHKLFLLVRFLLVEIMALIMIIDNGIC
jgi:hypothetical protein